MMDQVGRVGVAGAQEELLQRIAAKVASQLQLTSTDQLLDVCCGNGALSKLLLPYCAGVTGIDFSEQLVAVARQNASQHMQFHCSSAEDFELAQRFDKVLLYFSFQYFETYDQGRKVLQNLLAHAQPGALILLGDIPDQRRFLNYYNTPKRWLNLVRQTLSNRNDMGKFWHPAELKSICKSLGVTGTEMQQEAWQPYQHYRFDFLIRT